jgi:hypothetical protein
MADGQIGVGGDVARSVDEYSVRAAMQEPPPPEHGEARERRALAGVEEAGRQLALHAQVRAAPGIDARILRKETPSPDPTPDRVVGDSLSKQLPAGDRRELALLNAARHLYVVLGACQALRSRQSCHVAQIRGQSARLKTQTQLLCAGTGRKGARAALPSLLPENASNPAPVGAELGPARYARSSA